MADQDRPADGRLRIIATALKIPVEALMEEGSRKAMDTGECMRLWEQFRTDESRAAALNALRKALDDEGRQEGRHNR